MKKTKIAAIVAYILTTAAILLSGCSNVTTDSNDTVPQSDISRVAVLFSSLAEMWTDAGGEIYVTVGEAVERGFAPEGTPLVDSGAGKMVNLELLISYEPTLVICSADIPAQVEAARLLRENGIEVLVLRVESFDDYASAFKTMTTLTGNSSAYDKHVLVQRQMIDSLISEKAGSTKRVLFIRAGSSAASTKAKLSTDHFAAAMLSELGCKNIAEDAPLLLDGISAEVILTANVDHIFFSTMGNEDAAKANIASLLESDAWSSLAAVKNGNVTILPRELFHYKPCSRWSEAYSYLAGVLSEGQD